MIQQRYYRLATFAGVAATVTATLLIIGKLTAWLATGSSSLLASLTDSLMDVSASLINLLAIRYALIPADDDHKFGHGKAESLASLAQSAFITGSALVLIMHGIGAVADPVPLQRPGIGIWVTVGSLILTLVLVTFQSYVVKVTGSQAVKADALHYRSDLLLNGAVLLALLLSMQGFHMADGLFAILLGFYILWSALRIGYEAIQTLLDRELPEEECQQILEICKSVPGVHGIHDLRTRQSGPVRFIQLHLELDDSMPLVRAHAIADRAEARLRLAFPIADIIIHMDPLSALTQEQSDRTPADISPQE
ncbi:cation diffusion facilitator family transporter [Pseudaeromonas sp. ZJS20]